MKTLQRISWVFLFLAFAGCSEQASIPDEIIQPPEVVDILTDVCKVEARYQRRLTIGTINNLDLVAHNYQVVFENHQITMEEFTESYSYYSNTPELLQEIYDSVIVQLTQEQALLEQQFPDTAQ